MISWHAWMPSWNGNGKENERQNHVFNKVSRHFTRCLLQIYKMKEIKSSLSHSQRKTRLLIVANQRHTNGMSSPITHSFPQFSIIASLSPNPLLLSPLNQLPLPYTQTPLNLFFYTPTTRQHHYPLFPQRHNSNIMRGYWKKQQVYKIFASYAQHQM